MHRRPFIDNVIKLFNKNVHTLTSELDIDNYRRYKKIRSRSTPFDMQGSKLALEFKALKSQLLESNPEKFLLNRHSNLPVISVCRKHLKESKNGNYSLVDLQAESKRSRSNISTKSKLFLKTRMVANIKLALKRKRKEEENVISKLNSDIEMCNTELISDTKRPGNPVNPITNNGKYQQPKIRIPPTLFNKRQILNKQNKITWRASDIKNNCNNLHI